MRSLSFHDTHDSTSPGGSPLRWDLIVSIFVFAAAFLSQRWVLQLPLTAIDTLPTLAAARAETWGETIEVLLRELRGDDRGVVYYRPLTLITYTFDQWIHGGTAFGYHLTDVLLHAWAAVAVFWLARAAVDLSRGMALLAATIFLIHPATIEVVPAIARRQEPLLVIGLCLAVVGSRYLPMRRGWMIMVLGSLISVTSVERGLVVPAFVFGYLWLYRCAGTPLRDRISYSVRWTLPAAAIAVGFFAFRWWLHGSGDVPFRPENLLSIPPHFVFWLIYPQQMVDLVAPGSFGGRVVYLGIGALLAVIVAYPALRSPRPRMLWFAISWIGFYGLLLGVAGMLNPWYVYTAVPGLALATVFFAREAVCILRSPRQAVVRAGMAATVALLLVLAAGVPSPLSSDYPAWRVASRLCDRFLHALADVADDLPANTSIAVINLPAHFRESDSDYLVTRSAAILWPSSVRVWRQDNDSPHELSFIGAADFVNEASVPQIEFTEDGVRVYFTDGSSAYTNSNGDWPGAQRLPETVGKGYDFPWPAEDRRDGSVQIFVFDGEQLVPYRS